MLHEKKISATLRLCQKTNYLNQPCVRCVGHLQIDGRLAYLVEMTNTYAIKQFR